MPTPTPTPRRTWLKEPVAEQPPPNAKKRRPGPNSKGKWWYFLEHCILHPGSEDDPDSGWFRVPWPAHRKETVKQYASDIRHFKIIHGEQPLGVTRAKGTWEAYWGIAKDDNDIEHWYVWVRWIPIAKKSVRRGKVSKDTQDSKERDAGTGRQPAKRPGGGSIRPTESVGGNVDGPQRRGKNRGDTAA